MKRPSILSTRAPLTTIVLGLTLVASACGTSDSASDSDSDATLESSSEGCADDSTTTSTDPVSITDDLGRTVELDQPAERVVSLEWQQTEDLLSLCVAPVAVADVEGYNLWDTAEELSSDTPDVGTRGEASLDEIAKAEPDLVIIETSDPDDATLAALEDADIPVIATVGADAADPIAKMKATFNLIAEATGRTERAETVLAEFDTALAEGQTALAAADLPTTDFVYFDGWIDGGNVAIRPFGTGSLIGGIGQELGLNNVWTGETDPAYGLGQTDIEGLTAIGDASIFYTTTEDEESDIMPQVEENQVWQSLPAVEDGRTYGFPTGIWTFGGPRSSVQIVDAYVDLLTN